MNRTKEVEIVASISHKENQNDDDPESGSNTIDPQTKFIPQEHELEHASSITETVEVVVERKLILAASIGDDVQLEVTADQINSSCATAESQTVDTAEPLDEETTKQLRTGIHFNFLAPKFF